MTVAHLSELARSFLSLWAFLTVLVGVFSVVRSFAQKRFRYALLAAIPLLSAYVLWQILFDFHLFGAAAGATEITRRACALPAAVWIVALGVLTLSALAVLIAEIRCGRRSVTPFDVKECLDRIPCGVCCFTEDGTILFSNVCMKRLCAALTGERLSDGRQLAGFKGRVVSSDGRKWRFADRALALDGASLREVIASDVTAEYAETETLRRDQEELSRLNRELRAYTLGIDEAVRRREILQAKVNIHDEMNRLMLSTVALPGADAEAEDRIFSLWEQNALLLCMEADKNAGAKAADGIEKLAAALRIRLDWKNDLPEALTEDQRGLFFITAQEALANASKHAAAARLSVSFEETEKEIRCVFANDGAPPSGPVHFAGGLYNLSLLAGKEGASLSAEAGEGFSLILTFPKKTRL
ncbi:MAG: hypothetical protein II776_00680 [Clostridia bacterium]|nr:hypothetical protein [Clostridia bacterium]